MSHDTHGHHHEPQNEKPVIAFKAGLYFVLILAGLFIASIAFVKSMSHDEGGAHGGHHTEATGHGGHEANGHEGAGHGTEAGHSHDAAAHGEHGAAAPAHQEAASGAKEEHHH